MPWALALALPAAGLVIKAGGRIYFLRTDEIDWIEAEGNYVSVHSGKKSHLLRETISSLDSRLDRIKVATFMSTDRPHVLRQAIHCCRNFGVVSVIGVYGGFIDKVPMGSAINRGLTFRKAQTPVQRYMPKLLELIEQDKIDPSFVITHRASLEQGPELYKTFRAKQDGCIKVVMKP